MGTTCLLPVSLNLSEERVCCQDVSGLTVFLMVHLTKKVLSFCEKSCDVLIFLSVIRYRLSLAPSS